MGSFQLAHHRRGVSIFWTLFLEYLKRKPKLFLDDVSNDL